MSTKLLDLEWCRHQLRIASMQFPESTCKVTRKQYHTCMTKFQRTQTKGWYVSSDHRYTAELRPAGYYAEFACKLTRHYAIRVVGSDTIIGTARTLKEAERTYL